MIVIVDQLVHHQYLTGDAVGLLLQTGGHATHGARDRAQSRLARQSTPALHIGKHVSLPLLFFSRKGTTKVRRRDV